MGTFLVREGIDICDTASMDIDQYSVAHKRALPATERVSRTQAVYELFELDTTVTPSGMGVEMWDLTAEEDRLAELLGDLVNQRFK